MKRIVSFLVSVFLCFGIVLKSKYISIEDRLENHMNHFSQINQTHSDNIDDSPAHSHVHKHSEDGEEHEHEHDHIVQSNIEVKFFIIDNLINTANFSVKTSDGFRLRNFISSAHPLEFFRPPIS